MLSNATGGDHSQLGGTVRIVLALVPSVRDVPPDQRGVRLPGVLVLSLLSKSRRPQLLSILSYSTGLGQQGRVRHRSRCMKVVAFGTILSRKMNTPHFSRFRTRTCFPVRLSYPTTPILTQPLKP